MNAPDFLCELYTTGLRISVISRAADACSRLCVVMLKSFYPAMCVEGYHYVAVDLQ